VSRTAIRAQVRAGTPPNRAGDRARRRARFIQSIGKARIRAHEDDVVKYAHDRLREINSLRSSAPPKEKGAIGLVRDEERASGTMSRPHRPCRRRGTRRHPLRHALLARFGVTATCRASFGLYNTKAEVDSSRRP